MQRAIVRVWAWTAARRRSSHQSWCFRAAQNCTSFFTSLPPERAFDFKLTQAKVHCRGCLVKFVKLVSASAIFLFDPRIRLKERGSQSHLDDLSHQTSAAWFAASHSLIWIDRRRAKLSASNRIDANVWAPASLNARSDPKSRNRSAISWEAVSWSANWAFCKVYFTYRASTYSLIRPF